VRGLRSLAQSIVDGNVDIDVDGVAVEDGAVDLSATFVVDVFDNVGPHVHGAVFDSDPVDVHVNLDGSARTR
jgi:hypothetical protein